MKRTLAIALSTLALTATAAQAQSVSVPQPSFIDYVALDASSRSSATGSSSSTLAASRQAWPQPSFLN
jgi:hypothetical protein